MQISNWNIKIDPEDDSILRAHQVHGSEIVPAEDVVPGQTQADGILVSQESPPAGVRTADCMPLLLAGDEKALILHVSRKTLIAGQFDTIPKFLNPEDVKHVFIGPHICQEHFAFEWKGEEIASFEQKFPEAIEEKNGAIHLSLRDAVQAYFDEWNISVDQITEDGRCTYETDELPSWRRWREQDGTVDTLPEFMTTVRYIN